MRVLQVCPQYSPQTGGVETHVREISERLIERGHEVTVITADAPMVGIRRARRNGVIIHRHRGIAPGDAYHFAPGIATAVRRNDADVVHAHNYHAFPVLLAALAVGEERFIITPHYHGTSANTFRARLLDAYHPIGEWAVRRADDVVAVSEWEKELLHSDFGIDATVIPNGVDIERFQMADKELRKRRYLLTVGRLVAYKGIQHVIQALSELSRYELVVVGRGPYRQELERLSRAEGVADRVTFLESVEDERLAALYAGAETFLALSELEAYGLTVAEAIASGTPCVVRNAGVLAGWTSYTGVLGVDDVDPETVASAVRDAAGRRPDPSLLPGWSSVVAELETLYAR